jgi:nitrate/nitrite-specific signal transduction histidine kinase
MDAMLQKLEKYANHLESQVKERTSALEEEKHKTDLLLYRMLPPSVTIAKH